MAQLLKRIVVSQTSNVLIEDLGPSGVFLRNQGDSRDLLSQFVDGKNKYKFTLEQVCSSRSLDNLIKRGHLKLYDENGTELNNAAGSDAEKATNLATLKDIEDAIKGGGVSDFLSLTDTPITYIGAGGRSVRVNSAENGLEFYVSTGTDEKVAIDAFAVPGYLGSSESDGVLRTSSPLTYSDGGDFITLGLDQSSLSIISSQISDFSEAVDDRVSSLLISGTDISLIYDDGANTLTINYTGSAGATFFTSLSDTPANYSGSSGYLVRVNSTPDGLEFIDGSTLFAALSHTHTSSSITDFQETVEDNVANLIQNGTGITWTYNDGSNTLTGNVGGLTVSEFSSQNISQWTNDSGFISNISSFTTTNLVEGTNLYFTNERVDDRVADLLVAGTNITLNYNDTANTLTINSTATGVTEFINLTDTPASYSGQGLNGIRVNAGETALEFYTISDTDEKVAVDGSATAGYIGSSSNDGVLRTSSPLTYSDGGDFITLGIDQSSLLITSSQVSDFSESVDDRVSTLIQNGTDLTWIYDDGANTLTGNITSTLDSVTNRGNTTTNSITTGSHTINGSITTVDFIQFKVGNANPAFSEGQIYWDDDDKTITMNTDINGTSLQIGQEMFVRIVNKTGSVIPNGTVVYASGAQGNRLTVAPSIATNKEQAHKTIGVMTSDVPDNHNGYITTVGLVRDLDTSSFSNGETLYLSDTISGEFTNLEPTAPNHKIKIGTVVNSHPTEGIIYVHIDSSPDLDELDDINFVNLQNNHFIYWDNSNQYWTNKFISSSDISDFNLSVSNVISSNIGLEDLNNVTAPSPFDGDMLVYGFDNGYGTPNTWSNVNALDYLNAIGLDHAALSNIGNYNHTQIDTHIDSVENPHSTSDANLIISDITTNNVSTIAHGFTPKLSGVPGQFLNGQGNWTTPSGVANAYISQSFSNTTDVNVVHNFGSYPLVQVLVSNSVYIPFSILHNTINAFTVSFTVPTSGTIIATLGSPQLNNYIVVSNDYSATNDDYIIEVTGLQKTITLPTAVGISSKIFIVKNTSNGVIYVETTGAETIDTQFSLELDSFESISVYSNGSNYRIL